MSLKLNSSGGGSVTLQEPVTASALTLGLPAVNGTVITTADSGTVTPTMLARPLTLATAQNTTSGTSIDFTGIPSWAKRITVMFDGVSTNGSSVVIVQLGTSSSIENTGYASGGYYINSTGSGFQTVTSGFNIHWGSANATRFGLMTICLLRESTNTWASNHTLYVSDGASGQAWGGGSKSLGASINRVRVTTLNGTDTFDAGSVNIMYEG